MSTLNKSLPKASYIRFANSSKKNHHTLIYMPLGGAIQTDPSFACWQQNSYTYGFQAQYRVRARLTPANEFETGSTTKTTAWKHLVPTWDSATSIDSINSYIGSNSSSKWRVYTGFDFAGKDFADVGGFDKLEIDVRVRSFSNSKKQHGVWTTGTITVKCRPDVSVPKIVAFADGGLRFYLDLGGWTRGGSKLTLKSVMRVATEEEIERVESAKANAAAAESAVSAAEETLASLGADADPQERQEAQSALYEAQETLASAQAALEMAQAAISHTENELLKSEKYDPVDSLGSEDDDGLPYAGFLGSCFNTDFKPGEIIKVKGTFTTCDGVDIDISDTYTIDPVTAEVSAPVVDVEVFNDEGAIKVHAYKADENEDWDTVSAWIICDGKRYEPLLAEGENDDDRTFTFAPPFDSEIELYIGVANDLKFSGSFPYAGIGSIPSKGRVFVNYTDGTYEQPENGFNGPLLAVMQYDVDESTDSSRPYELSHPLGRRRPMAFLGSGLERRVKVKGSIAADKRLERTEHSSLEDWLAFEEQQGLVLLRMPGGYCSHAVCTGVSMENDNSGLSKSVSLSFEEVDV